jgi:hypothetical protein
MNQLYQDDELKYVDKEDLVDVLFKIETSYNIRFGTYELKDVTTFGELCDIICNKVELPDSENCTSQQAFYKIRSTIAKTKFINESSITLETELKYLFPRSNRRQIVNTFEKELGFKTNLLNPPKALMIILCFLLVISFGFIFIKWTVGLPLFLFSILFCYLAKKFGKEMPVKTVRQLVMKLSRENYLNVRRDKQTVNRKEMVDQIKQLFIHETFLSSESLTREAPLN